MREMHLELKPILLNKPLYLRVSTEPSGRSS